MAAYSGDCAPVRLAARALGASDAGGRDGLECCLLAIDEKGIKPPDQLAEIRKSIGAVLTVALTCWLLPK